MQAVFPRPKPESWPTRLFRYASAYRRDAWLATLFSATNKFFDILPEVLIGVAVDVVVSKQDSFLARLGITDSFEQLLWLGALTVLIWAGESLFEYLYQLRWRNLAQNLQHELRLNNAEFARVAAETVATEAAAVKALWRGVFGTDAP